MKDDTDKKKAKPTLSDKDIATERGFSRRRMLTGFGVGAAGVGLSGCVVVPVATGGGVTDADNGPITDPAGAGRGGIRAAPTGLTDADNGPITDRGGYGRGGSPSGGGGGGTGLTDADNGPIIDPGGCGRGARRSFPTGLTDSDNGPITDPLNYGRGARRC